MTRRSDPFRVNGHQTALDSLQWPDQGVRGENDLAGECSGGCSTQIQPRRSEALGFPHLGFEALEGGLFGESVGSPSGNQVRPERNRLCGVESEDLQIMPGDLSAPRLDAIGFTNLAKSGSTRRSVVDGL